MKGPSTSILTIRLLMEMVDHDYLFVSGSAGTTSHAHFAKRNLKRISATPEQTKMLRSRGRVYEYLTVVANGMKGDKGVAWYETAFEINEVGRKLVEDNRARIEAKLAAEKAENAKSERLVIIRQFDRPQTLFGIERKIAGLFRVTRQTDKRLFGVLERSVNERCSYGLTSGGAGISGATETYVGLEHVIVDPATPEIYEAMLKAEADLFVDLDEKEYAMKKEIAEIKARYRQRAVQSMAQTSDTMAEAGVPREIVDKYTLDQQTASKQEQDQVDRVAGYEEERRNRRTS